jgi:hypothetical protein
LRREIFLTLYLSNNTIHMPNLFLDAKTLEAQDFSDIERELALKPGILWFCVYEQLTKKQLFSPHCVPKSSRASKGHQARLPCRPRWRCCPPKLQNRLWTCPDCQSTVKPASHRQNNKKKPEDRVAKRAVGRSKTLCSKLKLPVQYLERCAMIAYSTAQHSTTETFLRR